MPVRRPFPEISYQIAEHATDATLIAGEIEILRLIDDKEIAAQLSIPEESEGTSQKHPRQTGR